MREKLIEGRYLTNFNPPAFPCPQARSGFPEHFVEISRVLHINQSVMSSTFGAWKRTSQIGSGPHPQKAHRTFLWLPYIPGKVTCVRETGQDILTGQMSGCWISRFEVGGARYVAHIGTNNSPVTPETRQVKAAWATAISSGSIKVLGGFNPASDISVRALTSNASISKQIYAVISGSGGFYVLVLGQPRELIRDFSYRILNVEKIPAKPEFSV